MDKKTVLAALNVPAKADRLAALTKLLAEEKEKPAVLSHLSNNHIHTTYSFSPYSPAAAIYFARAEGLPIAGIMDHDSISGAEEFREAGAIAGLGTTCGFEARISMKGTFLETRRVNNPDQDGVAYMTFHSIRREYFSDVKEFLRPYSLKRLERDRKMVKRIEEVTGVALDFEREVYPLSHFDEGGSLTERHILYALAKKTLPNGTDEEQYALLGRYKSELVPKIFIPAEEELIPLDVAVDFARSIRCYLCYAYLGDVGKSPTGDKKEAKYEDAYLDELVSLLKARGVGALTFMPSRNTEAQLDRVMALCRENEMFQISGEDVNSISQSFICEKLSSPKYSHLVKAAADLVAREL